MDSKDRLGMHKLYLTTSIHSMGDVLRDGPFRLGPPSHDGDEPENGYIVVPLTPIAHDELTGSETAGAVRVVARLSEPDPAAEEHLPSLNFDFNPALDPFLNGYPFPRFVRDDCREYLIAPVGKLDDVVMFAVTRVSAKRKRHIEDGLLTFRQAFKQNPFPVFLTMDFFSYSQRQHNDYGEIYLPPKGLRNPHLYRRAPQIRMQRIKKKVQSWNF